MFTKKLFQSRFLTWMLLNFLVFSATSLFGQEPKLVLPIGHTALVNTAQFSYDGKWIITASMDNSAMLWEGASGKLIYSLLGHERSVKTAQFSRNDSLILTCSDDNTAKVWETRSGELLYSLADNKITTANFSTNGRIIITVSEDSTMKLWDASKGQLIKSYEGYFNTAELNRGGTKIITTTEGNTATIWDVQTGNSLAVLKGHNDRINSVCFNPEEDKIVTTSDDSTVRIWDVLSGQILQTLRGHRGTVNLAKFSSNGKWVISIADDTTGAMWGVATGKMLHSFKGHKSTVSAMDISGDNKLIATASWDNSAKIFNDSTGLLLFTLVGHSSIVKSVRFSPDGKKVITASYDNTAKVWDAITGKLLFTLQGHTRPFTATKISPDGAWIATVSNDGTARMWDALKGNLKYTLDLKSVGIISAGYSTDSKWIAAGARDGSARIWEVATGRLLQTIQAHSSQTNAVLFSPDGKKLITASADKLVKQWDANTGKLIRILQGHTSKLTGITYSADGKYLASIAEDSTARIWIDSTGKFLYSLKGHDGKINCIVFSSDNKKLVTGADDKTVKIWKAESGSLLLTLSGHANKINAVRYSPDGKWLLTVSNGVDIKVWEANTGKLYQTFEWTRVINSAEYSPDGKNILSASDDNSAIIWDTTAGNFLFKQLSEHTGKVYAAQYSPDGKFIVTTSADNTIKTWDAATRKLLYTCFAVDQNDYLVVDRQSHFAGTEAARRLLYFTCGTEIIELDQVKDQLWIPDLAERQRRGETINALKLDDLNICGLTPQVTDLTNTTAGYYFKILPGTGGLGDVIVFVNGISAIVFKPTELKKAAEGYDLFIKKQMLKDYFIGGIENIVSVKANTADNSIASRGVVVVENKSKDSVMAPNLFGVIIGVSKYKGEELTLRYAAKDATDISKAVSNAARKLLNNDGKEHVFMYNLTTDNDRYKMPEKLGIKKLLEEIGTKAKANDILFIFFAGHGVMQDVPGGKEADKKQFYFLTSDASTNTVTTSIKDVGISTSELVEWMKPQNIKAQKRILILDACNSGQAINDMVKIGDKDQQFIAARNDDKAQQIKAIDKLNEKSGLFILSAAASNQNAYEMGRYSQGLLTYALLKAIKQEPGILEDGKYLNVSRWFSAAEKTVSDLAKENNERQDPQIVSNSNFNIGSVDDEVILKIILPEEKPIFTASNFQNSDSAIADDDLGISRLINQQLNSASPKSAAGGVQYIANSNLPQAYALSGRYELKENQLILKANLRQNKVMLQRFEVVGMKDKLEEMAQAVVTKAVSLLPVKR